MSVTVLFFILFFLFQTFHCIEVCNITSSAPLFVNRTLVSSNKTFELGFFTPNATTGKQYVGIWYKSISPTKIVWVANREKPVMSTGEPASLRIGTDRNLRLVDGQQNTIWSTSVTVNFKNSHVELLDDGNLVLKDTNSGTHIWESFHHPSDTFLPGMNLGINVKTGEKRYLASWKSETDPAPGNFVLNITPDKPPQVISWEGPHRYWRGGYWDKAKFNGIDGMDESYTSMFSLQQNSQEGTHISMSKVPEISFPTISISWNGTSKLIYWDNKKWSTDRKVPSNPCESYGQCGPFGICSASSSPICSCLTGFVPKSYEEWNKGNWTRGCIRQTTLNCQRSTNTSSSKDTFLKMSNMKLPDFANYLSDIYDVQECQSWCLDDCSCQAYSYKPSIGCLIWMEHLLDAQKFNISGEDLFIRTANIDSGGLNQRRKLISSLTAIPIVIILGVVAYVIHKRKAKHKNSNRKGELDWSKRFNIIQGIARGLLYLHRDSCLRVIHRDLKVSNILLDEKMNPKISDFGLARMFQGTQVLINTHKVVGTLGYMSPEYAMGGLYSEKLDVYSFGIILLEIVSGMKNSPFHSHFNLFFHAWQLWSQGRGLELMDETLSVVSCTSEGMRCIHVGLLCVQDNALDRPSMANVVLMLGGDSDLPPPKQPTFTYQNWSDQHVQSHEASISSKNSITNSIVEGR